MAGTGSIIYGVNSAGDAKRAGGWGHILGDEGSGYALGLAGVRAVTMIHDGRLPASVLKERVLEKLGLQAPEELVKWIHGLGADLKETVGQAGPVVLQAAEEGDQVARDIVDSALEELIMGVKAVLEGLDMKDKDVNIVLSGGVFDRSQYYYKNMSDKINKAAPNAKAILPICEPVVGGLIGAMVKMGTELNDDIRKNLKGSE
jgi:N-acetylglucosamine kinase-like BadF-type ATPase